MPLALLAAIAVLLFVSLAAFAPMQLNVLNERAYGQGLQANLRRLSTIRYCVFHHSAGPGMQSLADIAAVQRERLDAAGVVYHYVIDASGRCFQCNGLERITWHARGGNSYGVGVCLLGNFENSPPTEKQYETARQLFQRLRRDYPKLDARRHGEFSQTACPGQYFNIKRITTGL